MLHKPLIISHIRKDIEGNVVAFQSNEEHCGNVAKLARQFAEEFGMGDFGYTMGLLHDKGKEKQEFQEYIQDVNNIPGHKKWTQEGKAHAYVGGLVAKKLSGLAYPLIGNPIMGHHRGLYDYTDLEDEEKKLIPAEIDLPQKDKFSVSLPSWWRFRRKVTPCVRFKVTPLSDFKMTPTFRFKVTPTFRLKVTPFEIS